MAGFSEEHKKEMREMQFLVDLEEAFLRPSQNACRDDAQYASILAGLSVTSF